MTSNCLRFTGFFAGTDALLWPVGLVASSMWGDAGLLQLVFLMIQ